MCIVHNIKLLCGKRKHKTTKCSIIVTKFLPVMASLKLNLTIKSQIFPEKYLNHLAKSQIPIFLQISHLSSQISNQTPCASYLQILATPLSLHTLLENSLLSAGRWRQPACVVIVVAMMLSFGHRLLVLLAYYHHYHYLVWHAGRLFAIILRG